MDRQTIIQTLIKLGRGILEEQAKQSIEAPEADLLLAGPEIPKKHSKPNRKTRRGSKTL